MGHYDLYGNSYRTATEAMNAEMAQCAAIDADLAYQQTRELERRIELLSQPTEKEIELNALWQYVNALEDRIKLLEGRVNP